jgi:RNA polymerase sigma factor (sigma-70 family)
MAGQRVAALWSFRELFRSGPISGLDDGQLLERFATGNDEAAFAALVALHGPMVLGVCNRLLRDAHDIEDAFQATFLVLVKRAASIRDPGRLGPWLHGVARRVGMRARAEAARRRSHRDLSGPTEPAEETAMTPASRAEGKDTLGVIDQEIDRLPASFRDAVVLCDLEGHSYNEAARRLRCPLGTLQSRLARGRARLRTRLVSRGVTPLAVAAILSESARATVPEALAEATIRAATAGAVPATAAALAVSVARGLALSAIKPLAVTLIVATIVVVGRSLPGDGLTAGPSAVRPPAAPGTVPVYHSLPPRTERTLELVVLDGDNQMALPGATVRVRANWGSPRHTQATTDEEGRCQVALPDGALSLVQVVVEHPGFAPIEVDWSPDQPVPASHTVALERGVAIGGGVRDEQGRPIAGAQIRLWTAFVRRPDVREQFPLRDSGFVAAVTDEQGRWRSEALPASAAARERFSLSTIHPDYTSLQQEMTAEALRTSAAVAVLKTGRTLSGTVLSPTGRPIEGATIVVQSRSDRTTVRRVETDREGRFRAGPIIDPKWGEFTMVVRADGFASFAEVLLVPAEIAPQSIRLSPRRPLRGRVVDPQGRPVSGAIVLSPREFGFSGLDWEAETDADGRFVWYEAPATGSYMLNVIKAPFRQIAALQVSGGTEELTLTVHRPQHIHGTVTDAETGRPIGQFGLTKARGPIRPGWRPEWFQAPSLPFGGGRFDLIEHYPDQDTYHSIRIEAEGYEPAELIGYHDSQEDVAHDFKLRKAARLTGIVRGPDGRPMAGVDVAISGDGYQAHIKDGRLQSGSGGYYGSLQVRTGPDGRYAFPRRGRRVAVVAVHAAGFAIRSADEVAVSTDLALAPWARIEGTVKIGTRAAPGEFLVARLQEPGLRGEAVGEARSDESGRFVLDRVAPGRIWLYRRVDNQDRQGWRLSHPLYRDVKPGETVRLQVGGTGRPVVGRLTLPEGVKLGYFALGQGALKPELPEAPTPKNFLDLDDGQRSVWWEAFTRTPEGRAHVEARDRYYAVDLRPDGTFRADDVPAGRYVLKLPFEGISRSSREGRQAFARAEVIVPEMPGGRSDDPLDIGAIPLEVFPFHEPRVGEPAPAVAARAPDGRPLDLASLRGKFVLLHFWSSRPEVAAMLRQLKATHDAFGRDPRLVMIGLYSDETPGPMRRYADHLGLGWEQRYIGSNDDPNPFKAAYGLWFSPSAILIGPDGRILARDLQDDAIPQAVARALE